MRKTIQVVIDKLFAVAFFIMALYNGFVAHDWYNAITDFLIAGLFARIIRLTKYEDIE